jgi:hypothetical protein
MSTRIENIPLRLQRLDADRRGYPIPWNVLRGVDGSAIFTVNDDRKQRRALEFGLCPMCGEKLGRWMWFIGGPRSAFDPRGWYLDLPAHRDCARFALATCPYLAAPKYLGRVDVADPSKLPPEARVLIDHTSIPERPVLFVAVAGSCIEVQDRGPVVAPYVRPERPALAYEFWREGRQLDIAEALPLLREVMGEEWNIPEVEA